ncbi:putative precorrin-3B synthase [Streptomyces lydicamycinicus]|uniref:Putative precorrin-3B synthase n=2 Tax=Streptomyces lydicamycinicus TaxID=1546107 RepID=A0A0P4R3B4_9ACTN|nr:putative precorrin-3B synthase [Streptomyces lydicamycinicus]
MLAAMPPSPSTRPHGSEPPIRDRGDACPGALRLHSAADGHLARVRLPAGDLTVRQAEALADAADRLGDGHLSLTSRGNAELRGLPDDCGGRLAALLRDAGLLPSERHERIRNILASPLAGLDRHTPSDVRLWARELDGLLCTSESATALSGRFLFVLDDGRGDVAALGGDVSLVAEPAGTEAPADHGDRSGTGQPARPGGSALLRVGDDPAALRIAGPDAPRAALTAAEAFLSAAEASGAWRVRELPAGHGLTARAVAERLRGAGVECVLVAGATDVVGAADVAAAAQVAGAGTEAAPSTKAVAEAPAANEASTPTPYADSSAPGIIEGGDGAHALSVLAPLGRLSVAQWRLLVAVAAADGDGVLRLTPWRGIVIPGLSADAAAARLRELAAAGLITEPDSPWHRIGACTGRPGCAKSLTDVRADATAAVTAGSPVPTPVSVSVSVSDPDTCPDPVHLPGKPERGPGTEPEPGPKPNPEPGPGPKPQPGLEPGPDNSAPLHHLPVYWSGCERRCGHPHGAWVDVLATADGYRVSVVRPKTPPAPAAPPGAPCPTS